MTDKQIIIDGCDVSGCENYGETMAKTHNCTLYDEYLRPCKGTDCYYKNWKRKEQEYEELRQYHNKCCEENAKKETEWLEKYNQVSKDFYNGKYCDKENCNLLQAKEQECEELKKLLKVRIEDLCDSCGASSMMPMPCKVYEKTLTEIKEIAEKHAPRCNDNANCDYGCEACHLSDLQQILQKISECEGNDENN